RTLRRTTWWLPVDHNVLLKSVWGMKGRQEYPGSRYLMLVDFDGQLILTRRQIIKAVRAAVRDPPSFKFGTGRSCDFFSGRLEEDQRCLERCGALAGPFDSDPDF